MSDRLTWDKYFIQIAQAVSFRATCPRANVGAILVKDNRILATGYNGSLPGEPHCIDNDVGCLLNSEDRFCQRAVHAEANVLYQAAKFGIVTLDATMYFWDSRDRLKPCKQCLPAIISSGIIRVIDRNSNVTVTNRY